MDENENAPLPQRGRAQLSSGPCLSEQSLSRRYPWWIKIPSISRKILILRGTSKTMGHNGCRHK